MTENFLKNFRMKCGSLEPSSVKRITGYLLFGINSQGRYSSDINPWADKKDRKSSKRRNRKGEEAYGAIFSREK
jgi:hypothetical protein